MEMNIQLALLLIEGIVQDGRLSGHQRCEARHTVCHVGGPQRLGPPAWSLDEASPNGSLQPEIGDTWGSWDDSLHVPATILNGVLLSAGLGFHHSEPASTVLIGYNPGCTPRVGVGSGFLSVGLPFPRGSTLPPRGLVLHQLGCCRPAPRWVGTGLTVSRGISPILGIALLMGELINARRLCEAALAEQNILRHFSVNSRQIHTFGLVFIASVSTSFVCRAD